MTLNLAVFLEESARERPEKPALVMDGYTITYAGLHAAAKRFANALAALGVEPGDKVAMMVPNVPQFAVAYYGILRAGGVIVPLNVLLQGPEVTYHLDDSDSVALIA